MTPGQYMALTGKIDALIREFSMQEALNFSETATAVRAYMDEDSVILWQEKDGKEPVWDAPCGCFLAGEHRLSEHGASPEWWATHFYYKES